jgi:hypothetical protein
MNPGTALKPRASIVCAPGGAVARPWLTEAMRPSRHDDRSLLDDRVVADDDAGVGDEQVLRDRDVRGAEAAHPRDGQRDE